jgi:hypothetical protein
MHSIGVPLACMITLCVAPRSALEPAADWKLVVRAFEQSVARETYWVGLKNDNARPRAFCRLGIMFVYVVPSGEVIYDATPEYPGGGSPHACGTHESHLVLPGETYFAKVTVSLPTDAVKATRPRFSITAEETCVDRFLPCERNMIQLQEEGAVPPSR